MSEVLFHTGVQDKWNYLCRLSRRAIARGAQLQIVAPAEVLHSVDEQLWNFDPTSFVPHCRWGDPQQPHSPIVLSTEVHAPDAAASVVLVNLSGEVPPQASAFAKIIEIVGTDDNDVRAARQRWREYSRMGFVLDQHKTDA